MAGENIPIPIARTIKLGTRADGTVDGDHSILMQVGEVFTIAVDAAKIAGEWIYSADNITVVDVGSPSGDMDATYLDVRDAETLIMLDASDAVSGDAWRVLFDIHPTIEQTVKGAFTVMIA